MANASRNFFFNLMTSGKPIDSKNEETMDTFVRYILLNSMIFLGGSLLVVFGLASFRDNAVMQGYFDLSMASMTILAFVVLRTNAPFRISGFLTVIPYMCLCGFLANSGGVQGSGVLWMYSFPLLSIFLLGMGTGTVLSLGLLVYVGVSLFVPGMSPMTFPRAFAGRVVGVYTLVLVCTMVYEQTKVIKDRWVARLNRSLKAERDEITAMKDNLKVGLFLIDTDYVIQPQYSRALEDILSETDLSGKNFLDLLTSSIQQKERETLTDYYSMVFNRSYDAKMLEDINPLHQFTYFSVTTGEEKSLRCTFAPIDREDGKVYILGTVQDQTREVELQQQLSEEESKRQEEMRALFEVIHVEPRVLNDFIEDAEYEFDRINAILKDKDRSSQHVMIDIYQAVHAIKSNAVILGLNSFSTKLHELEREISALREKMDISFQEVLHITVELDKLMKVKDGFKNLIDKIVAYNLGTNRMQEEHVLVQTLETVISKASNDLGKKARLVVTTINPQAIERGPRRIIKEILMQLVRNSMYHGIENPEGRAAGGKDEAGQINLSIDLVNGKIEIQLTDDGRGLDFAAIRDKAERMNLLADKAQLDDKNALLQILFSPGFTTVTTADMYAGRGIGLNLVRERIKEVKGSIKLHSEDGKGTVFKIYIPAAAIRATGVRSA